MWFSSPNQGHALGCGTEVLCKSSVALAGLGLSMQTKMALKSQILALLHLTPTFSVHSCLLCARMSRHPRVTN